MTYNIYIYSGIPHQPVALVRAVLLLCSDRFYRIMNLHFIHLGVFQCFYQRERLMDRCLLLLLQSSAGGEQIIVFYKIKIPLEMVGSFFLVWFGCLVRFCTRAKYDVVSLRAGNGYVVCRTPDRRSQNGWVLVRAKRWWSLCRCRPVLELHRITYSSQHEIILCLCEINSTRSRSMWMTSDRAGDCERSTSRPTNRASG